VDIDRPVSSLQYLWAVEGPWKLILPGPRAEGKPELELFNVIEDPHENTNLAARHPREVARIRDRIAAWWPEGAAALRVPTA